MGWKEDFIEAMFSKKKNIKKGLEMYVRNAPQTVFRYRQGNSNDIEALTSNKIWLSNIKNVNDKFEGKNEILFDDLNLNYEFVKDFIVDYYDEVIDMTLEMFYIACFSENETMDNLWTHYADDHKGFCIEYYKDDFEFPVFPVIYKDKKPVHSQKYNEDEFRKSLLTKYSKWSDEKEWRILYPFNEMPQKGKPIDQPLPKAIYMGVDISDSLKEIVEKYCNEKFIDLYQMELNKKEQKLESRYIPFDFI
ncbi:DUF2971 domain-containing protein [Lacrimispora sp.]|uniref:DUF2971 domain-containing protein n=1 Tax=Lacrimispora sp. TaxID=2719234 RepID=UPI002FD98A11